ncbi:hypothetical protein QYM36_008835 [Artemia franciscana]|uniref:Endonuclease/exonuclease/phosphatase domain-containing protein n=1 Tax=Artemia franciscana TaxID=6661 RepID=A0AA88L0I3_ARTSF|nr:hypothetical protein QYM36_008835 [Artemia franciscana]
MCQPFQGRKGVIQRNASSLNDDRSPPFSAVVLSPETQAVCDLVKTVDDNVQKLTLDLANIRHELDTKPSMDDVRGYIDRAYLHLHQRLEALDHASSNSGATFEQMKQENTSAKGDLLCMGDFNLPKLKWTSTESSNHPFVELIQDLFLKQHVAKSKRYREGQTENILDLMLLTNPDSILDVKHLRLLEKSDHCCLMTTISVPSSTKRFQCSKREYACVDSQKYREEMQAVDWELSKSQKAPSINEIQSTPAHVLNQLNKLKPDKSPGPDCIHAKWLTEGKQELKEPILHIFKLSV